MHSLYNFLFILYALYTIPYTTPCRYLSRWIPGDEVVGSGGPPFHFPTKAPPDPEIEGEEPEVVMPTSGFLAYDKNGRDSNRAPGHGEGAGGEGVDDEELSEEEDEGGRKGEATQEDEDLLGRCLCICGTVCVEYSSLYCIYYVLSTHI